MKKKIKEIISNGMYGTIDYGCVNGHDETADQLKELFKEEMLSFQKWLNINGWEYIGQGEYSTRGLEVSKYHDELFNLFIEETYGK